MCCKKLSNATFSASYRQSRVKIKIYIYYSLKEIIIEIEILKTCFKFVFITRKQYSKIEHKKIFDTINLKD